ncbi:MAG: beta-ketoacyl-ACP synthase III [Parahaliea sp.]
MKAVYITSVAAFLPNDPVNNEQMESLLGIAGEKPSRARRLILKSNGIRSRHYAIDPATGTATHTNAELTAQAIRKLAPPDSTQAMDCLVCGTSLPDQLLPNHAVMVQGELGGPACEVVATSGVCLAGMTALKYAWLSIASGNHQHAVATGSELASAVMRGHFFAAEAQHLTETMAKQPEIAFEKDFLRWMLSDGAGAVRLQNQPANQGLSLKIEWLDIRSFANEMQTCMYAGAQKCENGSLQGWAATDPKDWLNHSVFAIKQDVKLLNENIVHITVERFLPELITRHGLNADDIDFFLPHYSSKFFRQALYDGMKQSACEIPFEKWATNLTDKGNTGSASIYIMLDELFHSGHLQAGQKILCYVPESGRFSSAFMLLTVCQRDEAA